MTAPPRSLSLVAAVLVIAVIAVDARVLLAGKTWADVRYHTEVAPPRLAAAAAIHAFTLPAWWDGTGLGVPLAAEPSHGAWYPPQWIPTTPRGLDLFVLLHLAWAGLGVAVWARGRIDRKTGVVRGASEEAALVAGLLAATTGLLASTALRGALPGLAHLPWLGAATAWLVEAASRRRGLRRSDASSTTGTGTGTGTGMGTGTATGEVAWAIAAIAGLLGLVGLTGSGGALIDALVLVIAIGARRRVIGALAIAVGAGLAIAAVQWIPAALLLAHGHVAGARVLPLPMARFIELIVPGSFGARDVADGVDAIAGHAPWAPSLFAGAAVLALAAVRTPAVRVRLAIVLLVALVLAGGRGLAGGWPAWLGAPELHLGALMLVLASHAGVGIDALIAGDRRALRALAVGAMCTAVALLALVVLRGRAPASAAPIGRAILDGSLGLACLVAALMIAARRVPGARGAALGRAAPVVLALLVLPSVGALPATAPLASRALVDEPAAWTRGILDRTASPFDHPVGGPPLRVFRPAYMFDAPDGEGAPAVDHDARLGLEEAIASLAGAAAWRWNIALARSDDPARASIHDATWLAAFSEGGALLDRFGVALTILPTSLVAQLKLPALGTRGKWTLGVLPVAPLAAVLRGNVWAREPADALALLYPPGGATGVLRGTVVLRGGGTSMPDAGPPLPCTIDLWRPGDVAIACTSDRPGYAVLSSSAAPGWAVSVDGTDTEWFVADVLRRAVPITAGAHAIRWRYTMPGQSAGLLAALAGLLALAGVLVASRRPAPAPLDTN